MILWFYTYVIPSFKIEGILPSQTITFLSLLLIFLSWPLCEEQGGCQNCPSVYADVVGNPWEDSHIKREGDARRKIKIKPLKEAKRGVVQA